MKHLIAGLVFFSFTISACSPGPKEKEYTKWTGKTMGTYYSIVFEAKKPLEQRKVDSIFLAINSSVSTYDPSSLISRFNNAGISDFPIDDHFKNNLLEARDIYEVSEGSFDPTVMPLVNYWGFGYTGHTAVSELDTLKIDSIRAYTGMQHISYTTKQDTSFVRKDRPEVKLDFSALAKGYAADVVSNWFIREGISNHLIEIGGDGLAMGKAKGDRDWRFGINEPLEDSAINSFYQVISLSDRAIATSGNYRNYHELDGRKYGHTINPKTGFPEKTKLLSATVIAGTSIKADALATCCMVKGLEESIQFIESLSDTEAYFIYITESGNLADESTSGFTKYILR